MVHIKKSVKNKKRLIRVTSANMGRVGTPTAQPSPKSVDKVAKRVRSNLLELWKLIKSLQQPGNYLIKKKIVESW